MNRGVARKLSHVFMATESNREQSTFLLGDLHSVRMKLLQSEIRRSRERIRESKRQIRDSDNSERFVIKKKLNVWALIINCSCNRDV
jgi:predicted RNA-binding protein with PIN domain